MAISHFAISSVVTDRASGTAVGAIPTRDVFNYRLVLVQGSSYDKCFQVGEDRSGHSPWVGANEGCAVRHSQDTRKHIPLRDPRTTCVC